MTYDWPRKGATTDAGLSPAACRGDVLMREGRANTVAAPPTSCVKRWGGCATEGPAGNSRCFYTHSVVCKLECGQHKSLRDRGHTPTGRPSPGWSRRCGRGSEPDAAPVRYCPAGSRFPTGPPTAITASSPWSCLENAIREKYGVGLNHMPSGRFAANAAWLAIQVMAHNLARWTARTGLGERPPRPSGGGSSPSPDESPARPAASPCIFPSAGPGKPIQSRPGPTASHSTPGLTAPSGPSCTTANSRHPPREFPPGILSPSRASQSPQTAIGTLCGN